MDDATQKKQIDFSSPREGRILLDGYDLREYDLYELRQEIGIIFQDFVRYQSATTGLPEHMCVKNMEKLHYVLTHLEEILQALTLDARDQMEASLPKDESPDDPVEHCRLLVRASVRETCRQHEIFRPMMLAWLEGEIAGHPSPVEPMAHSILMLSQIIRTARKRGFLETALKPEQVAWQIQHGAQFAQVQWALGRIDDAHFEARALYGLNLAFLGLVKEERRPEIQAKLKGLERKLRMSPMSEEGTS